MLAGLLIDVALKAMVVLSAAWGITRYMATRSSAAVRHLVWTVALTTIVALPLLVALTPARPIAVLPAGWAPTQDSAAVVPATTSEDKTDDTRQVKGVTRPSARQARPHPSLDAQRVLQLRIWTWPGWVVVIWMAGVIVGLSRFLVGLIWASSVSRRARLVLGLQWSSSLADAARTFGVRDHVPVLISQHTSVPVACGILRPRVLLPRGAEMWAADRRWVVLLHELAHVKRRDCLTRALAQLACAVYWFNPLVFIAVASLHAEQERACDDLVLAAGVAGPEYADHLWEMVRAFRVIPFPEWTTLAIARPSQLEGRVRAILDCTRLRQPASRTSCAMAIAIAVAGVLPLGARRLGTVVDPIAIRAQFLPARIAVSIADGFAPTTVNEAATASLKASVPTFKGDRLVGAGRPTPLQTNSNFAGTWTLDTARSDSLTLDPRWFPRGNPEVAPDTLVITQTAETLIIESTRDGQRQTRSYELDGTVRRYIQDSRRVPGGTQSRGEDRQAHWDGAKLITLTGPFSIWTPDVTGEATPSQSLGSETVVVRSLAPGGYEMAVERVGRHSPGWAFNGKEPSQAYSRMKDIYIRSGH